MTNCSQLRMIKWFKDQTRSRIFIDADDTIWHDSKYFRTLRSDLLHLCSLCAQDGHSILQRLNENLMKCGLGETEFAKAINITAHELGISKINQDILNCSIELFLHHEIELISHAEEALGRMSKFHCILLTKGNEREQKEKLYRSKLEQYFDKVIIVARKDPEFFELLVQQMSLNANQIIVIGNSVRHDILPAVKIGAPAIWLNHPDNEHGRNEELPREACEVEGWKAIVNALDDVG